MSTSKPFWLSVAGAAALFFGAWSWQRGKLLTTQREISAEREGVRDLAELHRQHERLIATRVSDQALENLRSDHDAVVRLRGEIDGLKKRSEEMQSELNVADGVASAAIDVPEQNWKNVGRATPGAAIETALWAGRGGDLDAMVSTLVLDGAAKEKAAALFASLPETERGRFGTPEKLIAALALKDLPTALTTGPATIGEDSAKVLLRTQRASGSSVMQLVFKESEIALRRDAAGWRLVVPDSAVDTYARALKDQGSGSP